MNGQENTQITRRDWTILGFITGSLIIILIILICVNAYQSSERQTVDAINTQQEAATVDNQNLPSQREKIHRVIKQQYGSRLDGYKIADGDLVEDGSWYITTIKIPLETQWSAAQDTYRIILHQNNSTWQIVAEPELILNYDDHPDIPRSVIYSANNL